MTYRSTQIYDFRRLDRLIDYDKLFDNAVESLSELHDHTHIDGFIGCILQLTYPDLDLIDPKKGGLGTFQTGF